MKIKIIINFCTISVALLIAAFFVVFVNTSYADSSAFMQTDWSGGADSEVATHADDQTGWNQYLQKDSEVVATTSVTLNASALAKTLTSRVDFSSGTNVDTAISGMGDAASIKLFESSRQVVAGSFHTCALKTGGTVYCWGYNGEGELGDNTTNSQQVPVQVLDTEGSAPLSDITQIAAGDQFNCALKNDGSVYCWGYGEYGQLGNGVAGDSHIPVQVLEVGGLGTLAGVTQITTGTAHACALKNDGSVYCWGDNYNGEIGDNTTDDRFVPVQVLGVGGIGALTDVTQITAGGNHTCALGADESAYCWGYNFDGTLGDNTTDDRYVPVHVLGPDGTGVLSGITQIAAGVYHTCAVMTDQRAYCWGYNAYGQLGDDTVNDRHIPVQVLGVGGLGILSDVMQITAGGNHTCAIDVDDNIFCWGANYTGQLGNNTIIDQYTPVQVLDSGGLGTFSNANQIIAKDFHTCVLETDGDVYCWGLNSDGQLGDNTTTERHLPVQVLDVGGLGYINLGSPSYASSGIYTSAVTDLEASRFFSNLSYNASVPINTAVTVDVRAGDNPTPDGTWTGWQTDIADNGSLAFLNSERYVQFQVNLSTTDTSITPDLDDVTFNFYPTEAQILTSSVYNTQNISTVLSSIQWTEVLSSGTDVLFQLRTSSDGTNWGSWCGPDDAVTGSCNSATYFSNPAGLEIIDDTQRDVIKDQYFQYRLYLTSTGLNPIISDVSITYFTTDSNTQIPPNPEIKDIADITKDSLKLEVQVDFAYANQELDFEIKIENKDKDDTDTKTKTARADENGKLTIGIDKLDSDTEYSFIVKFSEKDRNNFSGFSDSEKAKTEKDIEDDDKCQIDSLRVEKTNTGAFLTWDKVCSEINGILIERKMSSDYFKQLDSIDDNKTSFADENLRAYGIYVYRIRGFKGNKHTEYSNEVSVTFQNSKINDDQNDQQQLSGDDIENDIVLTDNANQQVEEKKEEDGGAFSNKANRNNATETKQESAPSFAFEKMKEFFQQFSTELVSLAFAGLAAGVAIAGSTSTIPLFSTTPKPFNGGLFRFFGIIGLISNKKKEYEDWGIVFDSETKQPIRGVIISLINQTGHVADTSVSDSRGRYGFLPNPGSYTIQISKQDYRLEKTNQKDALYGDTYIGGAIDIAQGQIEKINISLKTTVIDWQDFAQRKIASFTSIFSIVKRDFFIVLFYTGFIISSGIALMFPSPLNITIFLVYLALLAYQLFFKKNHYGMIKSSQTGKPVPFAIVTLYKEDNPQQRIAFAVSDVLGRYYLLTKNGTYLAKFSGNLLGGQRFEKLIRVNVKNGMVREQVEV
jgi:alpha-tubulin suppressor-like RCC1 family protein